MIDYYPTPTNPPSARGLEEYILGSSESDPTYSNYVAPGSSSTEQVNASGAPLYSDNVYGTTYPVANTNPSTGEFLNPTPQPGPAPSSGPDLRNFDYKPGGDFVWHGDDGGWKRDSGPSQAEQLLNSGYADYYKMLDEQMGALGGQRTSQEQVAQNTYQQGLNTVDSQLAQGQQDLSTNRQNTLRDLSDNLMRSFQQGNQWLGTRGASDSSAANQYSYALAKEGNRNRGDVQSQYDQNLFKLKNVYGTETKNLQLQKNNQLQQISQWFAEAQNSLRQQKGQAGLQKSQQALSMAMQMAQQVQQQTASKISALDSWATNNAKSWGELAGQLAQSSQFSMQAPGVQGLFGNTDNRGGVSAGYGQSEEEKNRLFR